MLSRSLRPPFFDRFEADYFLAGNALVVREFGVQLDMDKPLTEILYMISQAQNKAEQRANSR